ncbi:MAG: ATP-binding cassette domain-containing protein, partial [Hyphomicrobiales bacterium]|nr:ATP-binding cassette domain-containing protein [Hyphomicrobiales bacterium]
MNPALPSPPPAAGSPPDGAAIRIEGVTKRYGARGVLDGVGLTIADGAAVALIGANGAGKSTLLKALIRLVEPDSGRITMLGTEMTALNRAALKTFRAQVGMVFQRHNLVGRLSVLTNVVHGVQ